MGKCGRCVVLCCFGFLCEVEFELDVERDDEKMQIPALMCAGIQGKDQNGSDHLSGCVKIGKVARMLTLRFQSGALHAVQLHDLRPIDRNRIDNNSDCSIMLIIMTLM